MFLKHKMSYFQDFYFSKKKKKNSLREIIWENWLEHLLPT